MGHRPVNQRACGDVYNPAGINKSRKELLMKALVLVVAAAGVLAAGVGYAQSGA
jgi:hypothetical protein